MGISAAVEEVLSRRNARQFTEFPIEVRLIGISSFQSNVYPPTSRFVEAMPQGFLKSKEARIDARGKSDASAEKLDKVPVTVARLYDDFADVDRR